ncbi:hypothetical protein WJX72_004936 [[Myrmecia] bisecta]|uniref:TOG domain-containing protein n=1 Tax=[Myrmecia] bisecta TaxID=41462 RepID=A0AAW1NZF1_9CHLO
MGLPTGVGKLRFTIQSCSGEDPDYPATELLYHSPQTRGWQCPRFCSFPQEVVLRLEEPSRIQQIQILSHEYKIATKVEIFVGVLPPGASDPEQCSLKRLGFLSFDSNERSGHQARELKSVHVNTTAFVLRLLVHRCHTNKLNIYNQVGIVALNLIGELLQAKGSNVGIVALNLIGEPLQAEPPLPQYVTNHYNPPPGVAVGPARSALADLALDVNVDPLTAAKIRDINRMKEAAVANEDYDEAKRLKGVMERLRAVGAKIAQLEARKQVAVEREDYDMAKALKVDIDKLRQAGDTTAAADAQENRPRRANDPEEIFARVLGTKAQRPAPVAVPPAASQPVTMRRTLSPTAASALEPSPEEERWPQASSPGATVPYLQAAGEGALTPAQAYDDRPARARGSYDYENDVAAASAAAAAADSGGGPKASSSGHAPEGFPADLPAPEPLASADEKDAEPLLEVLGDYTVRCLFSKTWQLRDAALQRVDRVLAQRGVSDDQLRDLFKALDRVLLRTIKDRVANVFQSSLAVAKVLLTTGSAAAGQREVAFFISELVPILIDKTGETNTRIQAAASEALLFLAGQKDLGLAALAHLFVRPVKNQSAWRPILGRLQLISALVPQLDIAKAGGEGFQLEPLMRFVGAAFASANADVRSTALKVMVQVHGIVGSAVNKYIPDNLNPKMREQLDEALGNKPDAAPSTSAPAPAPAAGGPSKQPTAHSGGKKAAPNGTAGTAGAGPAAGQQHHQHHHQLPHHSPTHHPPGAEQDPGAIDEDPAPYEAELASRIKALGPDHVEVAESLSNLAILYNSRGEWDKAQPLYERALAIWEKKCGPEHPDVAHTLTDLAVLHLEQGRDDVGRPLLERALRIQEKALGPDHADVIAIRDVLNSEDD